MQQMPMLIGGCAWLLAISMGLDDAQLVLRGLGESQECGHSPPANSQYPSQHSWYTVSPPMACTWTKASPRLCSYPFEDYNPIRVLSCLGSIRNNE